MRAGKRGFGPEKVDARLDNGASHLKVFVEVVVGREVVPVDGRVVHGVDAIRGPLTDDGSGHVSLPQDGLDASLRFPFL